MLEDLSEELRRDMKVRFVTTIDEVLDLALTEAPEEAAPSPPASGELQPSSAS